jgi:hypothetical protein
MFEETCLLGGDPAETREFPANRFLDIRVEDLGADLGR